MNPEPRKRHRALWTLVCLSVILGGLAAIGVASRPTLERYRSQLDHVPVLSGMMTAMSKRVENSGETVVLRSRDGRGFHPPRTGE